MLIFLTLAIMGFSESKRVRDTLDRILGKIAAPIFPELVPVQTT